MHWIKCRPVSIEYELPKNNDTVTITDPSAVDWHIMKGVSLHLARSLSYSKAALRRVTTRNPFRFGLRRLQAQLPQMMLPHLAFHRFQLLLLEFPSWHRDIRCATGAACRDAACHNERGQE
jgi:hypothetical protein